MTKPGTKISPGALSTGKQAGWTEQERTHFPDCVTPQTGGRLRIPGRENPSLAKLEMSVCFLPYRHFLIDRGYLSSVAQQGPTCLRGTMMMLLLPGSVVSGHMPCLCQQCIISPRRACVITGK